MFNIGEKVVYGSRGIFAVSDITTLQLDGIDRERLYYVLTPVTGKQSTVYVPVDSDKVVMRRLISEKEAKQLISEIPSIELIWVENDKLRESRYRECISSCECREWIRVLKTLSARMKERIREGKKVTATDEKYYKMAEDYLYSELSLALSMSPDAVEKEFFENI